MPKFGKYDEDGTGMSGICVIIWGKVHLEEIPLIFTPGEHSQELVATGIEVQTLPVPLWKVGDDTLS